MADPYPLGWIVGYCETCGDNVTVTESGYRCRCLESETWEACWVQWEKILTQ